MPNSQLIDKVYPVPEHLQNFLGPSISYHNLKMSKTRMNKAKKEDLNEFNAKGGDNVLKWIEETLKKDRDAIHNVKQTGMNAGRKNQFIKPHEKDKDNANPTAVGGLPKMNKGNISRKIMNNKEVYNESIKKEISEIRYLIEYMNKNKKTI
jgi:hypothetical protein